MFIGNPPGNYDRILDFSTAVTGTLFFAPSADFLDDLPDPRAGRSAPARTGRAGRGPLPARGPAPIVCPANGSLGIGEPEEEYPVMNNLYRELAPITDSAWASIEEEARRTFGSYVAGRRIADVDESGGPTRAAVNTGHLGDVEPPAEGVTAHLRQAQPLVRLRVPFRLNRADIDDVERGAQDPDWQPLKDAAKKIAFAEDRAVFEGYPAAGITGLRAATTNPALAPPGRPARLSRRDHRRRDRPAAGRGRRPVLAGAEHRRL